MPIIRVPIELHVDGADQEVEAGTELPDHRRVFARDDVVRPETLCLIELALADVNAVTSQPVGGDELHGHVTQPANADNAYTVDQLGVHGQRREHGDAPA